MLYAVLRKTNDQPKPGGRGNKRPEVRPADIEGLKFFKHLLPLLEGLKDSACARDKAGNRSLTMDRYALLVLLYLFNPTLTSLRGIQQASQLKNVQKKLGCARASLGSLSESARVFDPDLLEGVIEELGAQLEPVARDGRLGDLQHTMRLVDGSVLKALAHLMTAALSPEEIRSSGASHRLHAQFRIDTHVPSKIELRPNLGKEHDERDVLAGSLESGLTYVLDRGYAKFELFNDIVKAGSSYVCRIRDKSVYETIEHRPLSQEAVQAGVISDQIVALGVKSSPTLGHTTRVVFVKIQENTGRKNGGKGKGSDGVLRIATNLLDISAEVVALVYQYRWTVEIFFRFLKHVLGCRHLLSQSPNGIRIQMYCAVIACMLISLWTGRKPNLRTYEMICHYFSGLADFDELMAHIEKLPAHPDPAKTN